MIDSTLKAASIIFLGFLLSACGPQAGVADPTADAYQEVHDVITQYYTFLDLGDYLAAHQLLSSAAQGHSSPNEYLQNMDEWFQQVEIVTVRPLYIEIQDQCGRYSSDTLDKKKFFVQIRAWGKGRMTGSALSGELQDLFITVVKENGEWKILNFATSP